MSELEVVRSCSIEPRRSVMAATDSGGSSRSARSAAIFASSNVRDLIRSNAFRHTPAGSVGVLLHNQGPWVVLTVKNTGMGIPEAQISQIFAEFPRASNARRSQLPGTGMGLAGVIDLVERFDGESELASERNRGSAFTTCRLPFEAEA